MQIRIAILILSSPGRETTPPDPVAGRPPLPEDWFLIDEAAAGGGRFGASRLAQAARQAKARGATHLAVWPGTIGSLPVDLQPLAAACRAHPEALIIASRPEPSGSRLSRRFAERIWPRFWLKMQTGRHLDDPRGALRLYPLPLIDHLRLYQRDQSLAAEILVKTAWAGVPFREIPLEQNPDPARPSAWRPLWQFLLNIHYTLRSVLPIPHRKLVAGVRDGERISVWRPMRSLRRLLSENTSPIQLALAAAVGVFLGTLPLIACHTLTIILAANYFRLNKVAALSASQLCMPPVVPALCIEMGYWLRHGRFLTEISLETLGYQALERLYEWLLGALVLAPLLAFLIGALTLLLARLAARGMTGLRHLKPTPDNGVEP
jgi:uncharacterized protein (DUF2062 family)